MDVGLTSPPSPQAAAELRCASLVAVACGIGCGTLAGVTTFFAELVALIVIVDARTRR